MTIFFTADTHFGHAGALALYRRPFASVAAMNTAMIARWNETVAARDTVWHLGDFALRTPPEHAADLLAALHGHKHLVTGNNDPPAITDVMLPLAPVCDRLERYVVIQIRACRRLRRLPPVAVNLVQ